MIGSKWLREVITDDRNLVAGETWSTNEGMYHDPQNQEENMHEGENYGTVTTQGVKAGVLNETAIRKDNIQTNSTKAGITVVESKKRRTGDGPNQIKELTKNTELDLGSDEEVVVRMDQDGPIDLNGPKNVKIAGLVKEVRQGS